MKLDDIRLMYEYNYWGNKRILDACTKVTPEQYTATTDFGNLRATVIHIVDAEWSWLRSFRSHFVPADRIGDPWKIEDLVQWGTEELTDADLPTVDALNERWQAEERDMRAYLGTLSDAHLNGILRYPLDGGIVRERTLWHCLLHVVNHGTQHRSEAAALLTSYGASPGGMDMTLFLNDYYNLPSPP
jgi:uncharacterized damage-inducible protein DinB